MKHCIFLVLYVLQPIHAQLPDSINFFPAHAGDVRQYRSQFTNQIISTEYFDKDSTDQAGNVFVWTRGGEVLKIDTAQNVYSIGSPDTAYLQYELDADTGKAWLLQKNATDSLKAKVVSIESRPVFGRQAIVKKIEYTSYSASGAFWIGNKYLATGFGMVRWDVEPSDVYILSGAFINGVAYGIVTPVEMTSFKPESFETITNYPNPFNGQTVVQFSISAEALVEIKIYDVMGREWKHLMKKAVERGSYRVPLDASDLTSGTYFVVMKSGTKVKTHKLLLLK